MEYTSPNELIAKIGALLQQPVDKDNIIQIEALRFELAQKTTEQMELVYEKENQMLHPKDANLTEMDRKVMLNASTALIKRDYEMLKRLEQIIKDRLVLFATLQRQP